MPPPDPGGAADESVLVLHVDDEPDFADLAASFLVREDDSFEVVTATNAQEGLDVLGARAIDCVVSDYEMPKMDGIEFLEVVREEYPDLPFVLFTGKGSEEVASDAIQAGVTDYLQKRGGTEQYALLANRVRNAVEKRRSQHALAERNRRLGTLVSNLPGVVYRCVNEPEWPMEFVGGECEELTGYSAETIESGEVVWGADIIVPDDVDTTWEQVQVALETRDPFELTYRIRTADGERRIVWERGRGIYEDNELVALEGFITDITERQHRKHELERKNARLEVLFENSPDLINVHDESGTIVEANRRFCDELGYTEEEVVGMAVWDVAVRATEADVQAMKRETESGDLRRIESTYERSDGSHFSVVNHLTQLDLNGQERYVVIGRVADD
ncbi:PAS domain-containing response regulator [Halobacterium wangiae]|uniref:PAS domain-containing response regulator n=1 Tax=Halobacterium wangiae TaxID=2902623 RepID=UPI001E32AFB0|nr:PAS domain S-box protein [Halobacterium wangiae]